MLRLGVWLSSVKVVWLVPRLDRVAQDLVWEAVRYKFNQFRFSKRGLSLVRLILLDLNLRVFSRSNEGRVLKIVNLFSVQKKLSSIKLSEFGEIVFRL